ncbi:hypothetical protein [Vibrio phage VCPH]|nr:hypothetical protein [Vibrio phage VCPH]
MFRQNALYFLHLVEELRKISHGELVTVTVCDNIVEFEIVGENGKSYKQGIDLYKLPTHQVGMSRGEALENAMALISMKAEMALHPTAHPPSERVH